uniref:Phospholipase A2 n=1 Tax=Cacopsylla melanoneura TaxID=428564 RepID=A0A8D8SPX6_9HEMI
MRLSRSLSAASLFCVLFPCWASAQFGFGGGGTNLFRTARRNTSPYKGYSGYVLNKENVRVVYYFDQTIVIVEVAGPKKELRNCEVIEVYDENDTLDAMETVRREVGEPFEIDMDKMVKLMKQCQLLAPVPKKKFEVKPTSMNTEKVKSNVDTQPTSAYPLLNGIIPGTKWCGTGDIADTYFDMGTEVKLDKCCRTHDLCPSKIRAHTSRYNMTNNSIYTKSHCTCDKIFRACLKATKSSAADLMGEFYFNIFRVPCLVDTPNGKKFKLPQNY